MSIAFRRAARLFAVAALVAVGYALSAGPAAAAGPYPQYNAVSCPSAHECVAAGAMEGASPAAGIVATFDPASGTGTLAPVTYTNGDGADLDTLSCPTTTECVTVTAGGARDTFDPTRLANIASTGAAASDGPTANAGLGCPSSTQCTAVSGDGYGNGYALTWDPTSSAGPSQTLLSPSFGSPGYLAGGRVGVWSALACPSATQCTSLEANDDGTEGELTFNPQSPGSPAPVKGFFGQALSCPTTTECVGVEGAGDPVDEVEVIRFNPQAPSPRALTKVPIDKGGDFMSGFTCASATLCSMDLAEGIFSFNPFAPLQGVVTNLWSQSHSLSEAVGCASVTDCADIQQSGLDQSGNPTGARYTTFNPTAALASQKPPGPAPGPCPIPGYRPPATHSPAMHLVFSRFCLGGGFTYGGNYANREPWNIVRGADGNLWFNELGYASTTYSAIGRITPSGAISLFTDPYQGQPDGVALGYNGNIWFTNDGGNDPSQPDGSISYTGQITPAGQITDTPNGDNGGSAIARGPGGAMWFVGGRGIAKVDQSGNVTSWPLPPPRIGRYLVEGPDGNVWFTSIWSVDSGAWDEIGRITPTGSVRLFRLPHFNEIPDGITVGPDGAIWFGERAGKVGRITMSGKITEFPVHPPKGVSAVDQIVTGPDGNMWFLDAGQHAIGRITPKGQITEFPVPDRRADMGNGLAFGDKHTLWFTETYGGAIWRAQIR